jgi:N-acetylneuraminic acid mutarotase
LAFYKDKLYVLGGGTSTEADSFNQIHAFDVQSRTWEKIKAKPGSDKFRVFMLNLIILHNVSFKNNIF